MAKKINNKRNFEIALIATAVLIGIIGYFAYKNNPVVFHQLPLFKMF